MMDTLGLIAGVYSAFIVGLISPGPDLLLILALAGRDGIRAGLQAAAGIALGVAAWVAAGAAGVATLMQASPEAWQTARLVAGVVLIYMGARALSAAIRGQSAGDGERNPSPAFSSPFLLGLATNLINPKAGVVLIGLMGALATAIPDPVSLALTGAGMPFLTLVWFATVSALLAHPVVRLKLTADARLWDGVTGVALAGVGALLLSAAG